MPCVVLLRICSLEFRALSCLLSPPDCVHEVKLGPFRPLLSAYVFKVVSLAALSVGLVRVVVGGNFDGVLKGSLALIPNGDGVEHILRHFLP